MSIADDEAALVAWTPSYNSSSSADTWSIGDTLGGFLGRLGDTALGLGSTYLTSQIQNEAYESKAKTDAMSLGNMLALRSMFGTSSETFTLTPQMLLLIGIVAVVIFAGSSK